MTSADDGKRINDASVIAVADYPKRHLSARGAQVAVRFGERIITYLQLDRHASQIANGLIEAGIGDGARIGFIGRNCPEFLETLFAVGRIGAVLVPVNHRLSVPEIAHIFADAGVTLAITEDMFSGLRDAVASRLGKPLPCIQIDTADDGAAFAEWRRSFSDVTPERLPAPNEAVMQLYTSGTTGQPKGVLITNAQQFLMRKAEEAVDDWGWWDHPLVLVCSSPFFHVSGTCWALYALYRGGTVVVMPVTEPTTMLDIIERDKATHVFVMPTMLREMLETNAREARDLGSLRYLSYGAAPMPPPLLARALQALPGCGFVQHYGSTEAAGTLTLLSPQEHDPADEAALRSCGRPLAGVDLEIRDPGGRPMPSGQAGEIHVRCAWLVGGYWKKPAETKAAFVDGWYRTGDGGYLDQAGRLVLTDRVKDMIITGGENVYPIEVERALYEHPAIRECAVIGLPDDKWGEAVCAFIVLEDGAAPTDAELIDFLRASIGGFKIPKRFHFVGDLPYNASGKVQKHVLRAAHTAPVSA